ncbi:cyanophycinase [Flavobacterium sp. GSP27]|uniref:Cyanophycinase n=1 Tax=Flavobacterium bomense TaxID=2497483 RepID=A0A3S0PJS1_9FLAO|nr:MULTISPECIES: cyanophycinase [Flavobacterium]RTY94803.1 cyanophycinase [Flavobacterium sp. GSN2]RTY81605.1 cyanophycinase [Flavobacterium sp. ZB4P23]RTZ06067.1 cyanophycinase [Flavobacterium bomense]RTZ07529.1 cyanophycinase [Flavobacterium sp. GSP6]RTZ09857.1 cyanophycinase [Flavobacterium sp. GSP27]
MNKSISISKFHFIIFLLLAFCSIQAQTPKGTLFIIGGGNRSDKLMTCLLSLSKLEAKDYIVVLPMSSEEPDSAYIYFNDQLKRLTSNPIVMLNFDKKTATNPKWIDSLQKAKLIFISGGDQTRFMDIVKNTPIKTAIHQAYKNGSTVAGTSAGAAVMCEHMITGNQKLNPVYTGTFDNIRHNNLETTEGLGLMKNVIIDQHFLKRSRYNRLLSAMVEFPSHVGIGIDEATAIIVQNKTIEITGESEVIVIKNPKGIQKSGTNNLISIESLEMSIYNNGQKFKI